MQTCSETRVSEQVEYTGKTEKKASPNPKNRLSAQLLRGRLALSPRDLL